MKRAEKRDHLIDVATRLFNEFGYRAVGIDRIIEEAGIAKTTLYRYFKTKEDLIVAVLKRTDEQFRDDMRQSVESRARDPKSMLLASFDFLESWFKNKLFFGCPFLSAAGEYSAQSSAVFQEAKLHKRLVVAYLEELTRAADLDKPQQLAEEINLLHEGATAVAHITRDAAVARKAKEAAERLIDGIGTRSGAGK